MSAQVAELLLGLFFVGNSFPGFFVTGEDKVSRVVILQFIFGAALCLLAFLNIGLIGVIAAPAPQASAPAAVVQTAPSPAVK